MVKEVDLLMVGDSIVFGWSRVGKKVWDEFYGKRKAVTYHRFMRDYIKAYKAGKPVPRHLLEKFDTDTDRMDFDMDEIPNNIEGDKDTDRDGTPDKMDLDSDNDGIPDWKENSK